MYSAPSIRSVRLSQIFSLFIDFMKNIGVSISTSTCFVFVLHSCFLACPGFIFSLFITDFMINNGGSISTSTCSFQNIENEVSTHDSAIMWLWERHNRVNARLRDHTSTDPQFPKVQFPPPLMCPECRNAEKAEYTMLVS